MKRTEEFDYGAPSTPSTSLTKPYVVSLNQALPAKDTLRDASQVLSWKALMIAADQAVTRLDLTAANQLWHRSFLERPAAVSENCFAEMMFIKAVERYRADEYPQAQLYIEK